MKAKDIPSFEQQVLGMLPITQAEAWKCLGIGHRDGSALVSIMLGENLIKKTRFKKTFIIEIKNEESKKPESSPLLSNEGKFSPCCGCGRECELNKCELLTEWLK
jgi:hypothetical protein